MILGSTVLSISIRCPQLISSTLTTENRLHTGFYKATVVQNVRRSGWLGAVSALEVYY